MLGFEKFRLGRVPLFLFSNGHLPIFSTFRHINAFSLRTHNCGELRLQNVGEQVKLYGWLDSKRMNKFILLRDAYGSVQAVLPRESKNAIDQLEVESAVSVEGTVADRGKDRNSEMDTGDIEIRVNKLEVLNASASPLPVRDTSIEQTRLTHRYLDLRSKKMQRALRLRASVISEIRRFLEDQCGFIDVQTPTLAHPTPGGAAEFPVPATSSGDCFSLPQSPQIYKQLLMCGSIDRYYQFAICYRDEDAKPDRQPEFTQLDLELSFTNQEMLMSLIEQIIVHAWLDEATKPSAPFPRLSFHEAIERFGTDKPDLRISWEIMDYGPAEDGLNKTKLFIARGQAEHLTAENISNWNERLEALPHKQGLTSLACTKSDPALVQMLPNFAEFARKNEISEDDIVVICQGDNEQQIRLALGTLRNCVADSAGLRSATGRFELVWVQHFPLFTRNSTTGRLESSHHPFTAPVPEHLEQLREGTNLERIQAQHYDLVLNGVEIGGGSIRIHDAQLQRHVLERILGLGTEQLAHFLDALSYGAPPHGGFALGMDRFIAILNSDGDTNCTIRDVMAFPKASSGRCLMTKSPVAPSKELLDRYGLTIKIKK